MNCCKRCGKPLEHAGEYCDDKCFLATRRSCRHCGKKIRNHDGEYCNHDCYQAEMAVLGNMAAWLCGFPVSPMIPVNTPPACCETKYVSHLW